MSSLIYDENTFVDNQLYKYDQYLHSRINKYTGDGRTLVTYFNINDEHTTLSLGMYTNYQVLGNDSPLRYNKIDNMILLGFSKLSPEESQASGTTVRDYKLNGEAYIIPGTIMPKENDFFIINHINMNHLFRVTQVTQDGLNTDGSYRISYALFSTDPIDIQALNKQVVGDHIMDLQTIGGEDLTPIIGKEDYELRSRLIKMVNDMVQNYISRYYDQVHNCFICRMNGQALFDLCGNAFMAKNGVMINDNSMDNIILNENKLNDNRLDMLYEKSPYKWIERDAPLRYLETFKYHTMKGYGFYDSSFYRYGADIDVMIPDDYWCNSGVCEYYFPPEVVEILEKEYDPRPCAECDCKCCSNRRDCCRHHKLHRYDYISIIRDFIHGKLTDIHKLSLYTGDQLFDNMYSKEVYLWTPIIIYILKQTLKIK